MSKEKKIKFTFDERSWFDPSDLEIVNQDEIGEIAESDKVVIIPILDDVSSQKPGCVQVNNKVKAIVLRC